MTCPWTAVVCLGDGPDYSAFDSGHDGANAWLEKAADQHGTQRISTRFLVCGETNCGFYSLKQIAVRGTTEQRDEVAALVVWLALDKSHHGVGLGKLLMLEVLAACVEVAEVTPYRHIVLDLDPQAPSHVGTMYERMGFVRLGDGRYRMKVSKARATIEAARVAGVQILGARESGAVALQA